MCDKQFDFGGRFGLCWTQLPRGSTRRECQESSLSSADTNYIRSPANSETLSTQLICSQHKLRSSNNSIMAGEKSVGQQVRVLQQPQQSWPWPLHSAVSSTVYLMQYYFAQCCVASSVSRDGDERTRRSRFSHGGVASLRCRPCHHTSL